MSISTRALLTAAVVWFMVTSAGAFAQFTPPIPAMESADRQVIDPKQVASMTPQEVFDAIVKASPRTRRCGVGPHPPPDPAIAERESRVARDPLAFLPIIELALASPDPESLEVPDSGHWYPPVSPAQWRAFEARVAASLLKFMPAESRDALIASHFTSSLAAANRLDDRIKVLVRTSRESGDDPREDGEFKILACRARWFGDRCDELTKAAEDSVSPILIEPVFMMLDDSEHHSANREVSARYLECFPARYPEFRERLKAILVKLGKHGAGEYAIITAIEWMQPHYPKFPQPAKK